MQATYLAACFFILWSHIIVGQSVSADFSKPPEWTKDAVWYQIFVERFRNGNNNNNPRLPWIKGALLDSFPDSWEVTPWGHNWYAQENWASKTGLEFYRTIQMRRYGGDLEGVREKINYLVDLGINVVYFNPLNHAPSLHKYDAAYYHHIDACFGPDPEGDLKLIATENPGNPATWVWTSADRYFVDLIKSFHEAGIKVVLDFSWNHTGNQFWAFKDVKSKGARSAYSDWYAGVGFSEDGNSLEHYDGWFGIATLPELKKINTSGKIQGHPYEGDMHPEVVAHIEAVSRRWMDPDGDGNPADGIDGMRLDVAEHVPLGFWRSFRKFVRSVNPDFYLIGENWWTSWPDVLMDPVPWVKGDIFDAVMHYQWYKVARGFFAKSADGMSLDRFKYKIDSVFMRYSPHTRQAMMNLGPSHDAPRLLTDFTNLNKYKYRCKPSEDPEYYTGLANVSSRKRAALLLLHQFTFTGAPHIWNGDEMGMTGGDDPDNRKPLWWQDISFSPETQHPASKYRYSETPFFDSSWYAYYKKLIRLRKSYPSLRTSEYTFEEHPELLIYRRTSGQESVFVIINPEEKSVQIPDKFRNMQLVFSTEGNGAVSMMISGLSGIVLKK